MYNTMSVYMPLLVCASISVVVVVLARAWVYVDMLMESAWVDKVSINPNKEVYGE